MQKNVMVQDAAGQIIGSTYPKRAKGLLKSGRAVLVDDHTIQLCASAQNTAAPILKKELHMEDLLFCAPAFSTKSRFSTLLTVTDADGDPMELWELDATEETVSATICRKLPINSGLPLQAVPKPNGFAAPYRQTRTPKPMHWNRVAINQITARMQTERCCGHFLCPLPAEQMARFPFSSR